MSYQEEVDEGRRFEFGKNWSSFLAVLDEDRIREATVSLCDFLQVRDLDGKSFLDIGSGSGLFSLAARQLGAQVRSFDYDPEGVGCTRELRRRYFPDDPHWHVEEGSVLERGFVEGLGKFDVCYSWGVLHHTGHLWRALYNAHLPVQDGGLLLIAVYRDQGIVSSFWEIVKRVYVSGRVGRILLTSVFYPFFFFAGLAIDLVTLRNPTRRYKEHRKHRGMSLVHDWKDWLGGYPYEPATPGRVISYFENLGFELLDMKRPGHGFGNNQFLLRKKETTPCTHSDSPPPSP